MNNAKKFPNSSTFIAEFGAWNIALRAAGLNLNKLKHYTNEELLQLLRILAERISKSPSSRDMSLAPAFPDSKVFITRFQSWNKALLAAGLEPNRRRKYSDMDLIILLRRLARRLGRSPSYEEANHQRGFPCALTFRERFGTWNNALEKAGLERRRRLIQNADIKAT